MKDWIRVEDRLPEWYQWIHIWSQYVTYPLVTRRVETGDFDDNGESKWSWDWSRYAGLIDHGVSYWMPLPEPPEDEK